MSRRERRSQTGRLPRWNACSNKLPLPASSSPNGVRKNCRICPISFASNSPINFAHWLGKLANLNVARTGPRGIAPHKPLMLLTVIDLIESGDIPGGWVRYDVRLVSRFGDYWELVQDRQRNSPEIPMPFHALGSDKDKIWERFTSDGQNNATWLAGKLTALNGCPITVSPVLVLPGWWVDAKGKDPVAVFNPKGPPGFLEGRASVLSEKQFRAINAQLEERCQIDLTR